MVQNASSEFQKAQNERRKKTEKRKNTRAINNEAKNKANGKENSI